MPIRVTNRVHFDPATQGAAPYVTPGTVGFLGDEGDLDIITDTSVITAGPGTYEGNYFNRGLYLSGAGTYIFRQGVIEGTDLSWLILAYDANLGGSSTILLEDMTLRWKTGDTLNGEGQGAIVNLGVSLTLTTRRCDISGKADGMQVAGSVLVEDTYIHDLVWAGTPPNNTHNDGVQCFEGDLTVTGSFIRVGAQDPYSNSCLFFQGGDIDQVVVDGNYLSGGGYSYYAQNGAHTVTNNTFNTDNSPSDARLKGHLFSTHTFEGAGPSLVSWTGNVDETGAEVTF